MSNRAFNIALAVSITLHLLAFVSLGLMESWNILSIRPPDVTAAATLEEEPLQFQLVESPKDLPPENPKETNLVSDKSGRAHNPEAPSGLSLGEAYSKGLVDIKNLPTDESQRTSEPALPANGEAAKEVETQQEDRSKDKWTEVRPAREFTRQYLTGEKLSEPAKEESPSPRYDQQSTRAPEIGGFSFNTYAWDYAPYLLALRRKIQRNIFPPPAFTQMGIISGETVVRFRIYPNGELGDLQVLDYKGHRSLVLTSVNAVKFATPFMPLPKDFPEEYLEVTGTFSYVVVR